MKQNQWFNSTRYQLICINLKILHRTHGSFLLLVINNPSQQRCGTVEYLPDIVVWHFLGL